MAGHRFRALGALPERRGLIPSHLNGSSQPSVIPGPWRPQALPKNSAQTFTQAKHPYAYNKKEINLKKRKIEVTTFTDKDSK